MTPLRAWFNRVTSSLWRRALDDRLRDEIETHLEMATNENIARGMPPDEARHAALRSFGGVTRTREVFRDAAGWPVLDALWQDLSYALRSCRRAPGLAFIAIVTLGLAIGANTAIFSLLNALVLRDLPVRDPGSLVQVSTTTRLQGGSNLTFPMFRELFRQQQVFSAVIGGSGNTVVTVNDSGTVMNRPIASARTIDGEGVELLRHARSSSCGSRPVRADVVFRGAAAA
jgi:hypothetical protein